MLSILKKRSMRRFYSEPELPAPENTLDKTSRFSYLPLPQVLDTVYNLGVLSDISKPKKNFIKPGISILTKQHNDNFDQIVASAGADHL